MLERNHIIKSRGRHTRQRVAILLLAFAWVSAAVSASPGPLAQPDVAALPAEVNRIAASVGGEIGLAAWRLDGRGPRFLVNADKSFPMASTFKVAVAGALFAKIDRGELALDQMLPVPPGGHVGTESIADPPPPPRVGRPPSQMIYPLPTPREHHRTHV